MRGANKAILYAGDNGVLAATESDINDQLNQFETSMANYNSTIASDTAEKLFAKIMDSYNGSFKMGVKEVLEGAKANAAAEESLLEMEKAYKAETVISNDMAELVQVRMEVMSDANKKNKDTGDTLLIYAIIYVAISFGVSTVLCLKTPRTISNPIIFTKDILLKIGTKGGLTFTDDERKMMEKYAENKDETGESAAMLLETARRLTTIGSKLEAVANGDLTTEIDLLSDRDTMGLSLRKMVGGLNGMFHEINSSSGLVSSGSKQISNGAQLLVQGTTEQAAAVEQLTNSLKLLIKSK